MSETITIAETLETVNIEETQEVISIQQGVSNFIGLTDTPTTYSGQAGKFIKVNTGEDAVEFVSSSASISWGGITGILSNQTDLQTELDAKLDIAANLSDVADQQTALNNVTNVSAATNEYVLTKDTATGNAVFKASAGGGAVDSVNGQTGVVVLDTDDISEGTTNLYDQTVSFTGGTNVTVGGTYPSFTLTDNSASSTDLTSHTSDSTIHFTQANIDHTSIQNIGSNTHAQIDTHIGSTSNPHSTTLDNLGDTVLTTVADNEVLAYDNSSSKWINQTAAEAGLATSSDLTTHTGDSTIHYTQASISIPASQISDFDTEVSNNTDVSANTSARHVAVTVLDSSEIDFTLTGQQITASLIVGSIDETKLDTSVNASLDLADSSLQPGDIGVTVQGFDSNTAKYDDVTANFTGTLQNGGSNVLVDTDIGTNVQAYSSILDNTTASFTTADETKLDYISITQAVDLDTVESLANSAMQDLVDDTTPQLGGDLDWNSNGFKLISQTVGGSNGNLVYLSSANTWSQSDASGASTSSGMLGIRISSTEVLTKGIYTTTGLTAGSTYYISETAGNITTTAPTTSGAIVRIIGYALSTTELFFDPDKTYIEV